MNSMCSTGGYLNALDLEYEHIAWAAQDMNPQEVVPPLTSYMYLSGYILDMTSGLAGFICKLGTPDIYA